jgi:uncharacterized protein YkwD
MKNLITIIALFITTFVSAQTKLDSLVLVKVNEYRISKGLTKVQFDTVSFLAADNQASYLFKNDSVVGHSQKNTGFETPNKRYIYFGGNEHASTAEVCNGVPNLNIKDSDTMRLDKIATAIVESWKKSPDHNKILITAKYKFAGVGTKVKTSKSGFVDKVTKEPLIHYKIKATMVFTTMK